jgi:phage gp29-like protein
MLGASNTNPIVPRTDDVAFQPPSDPLQDIGATIARARIIHREIPNVVVQAGWQVQEVRAAIVDLTAGVFDRPSQLQDAIAADSRVQSAMRSRSGGLLGRPIRFKVPDRFRKDERAKKCLRAWERHWPMMGAEPALLELLETGNSLGFSYAQILWDTGAKVWLPYLQSFNTRYGYYHWNDRHHIAMTLDGQVPVTPGDGHWVLHAPYGQYRGWMRGALRALAQWWLARIYALRDWARYCERHGFPIMLADTPFGADPTDIAAYTSALSGIGQESVLQLPGGPDVTKYGKYDLRYLEPADANWQAFKALIEQCNDEITLALLGQNLTSQVKEGSFAAARVHADVRQAILEADARALAKTLYTQVARPFAALNFGDADLAPVVAWDVRPAEDFKVKADTFHAFAGAISSLRTAGFALDNPEKFAIRFGLPGLRLREVPPVQIEAQLARATGQISTPADPMPSGSKGSDDDDTSDKDAQ